MRLSDVPPQRRFAPHPPMGGKCRQRWARALGAARRARETALRHAFLVLLAAFALVGCGSQGPEFRNTDVTGAEFGRDFALKDPSGNVRTLADFRGKAVVLFFGFTHCPDVCPAALATVAEAMRQLGGDAARVQGLFITVDPERDTPELLARYATAFHPSFVGLSGDADATARVAKEFKVLYQKSPGATPGSYTMDHSAGLFVFDPQGRLRLYASHGRGADALAHDLRALLRTPA